MKAGILAMESEAGDTGEQGLKKVSRRRSAVVPPPFI